MLRLVKSFDPLIKHGVNGVSPLINHAIKAIPSSNINETVKKIPKTVLPLSPNLDPIDEKLDQILSNFSTPINATIGYGSGVFAQQGYKKGRGNPPQIDLLQIVENTEKFHTQNLSQFPYHYLGLRWWGIRAIEYFQKLGAGLYFNPYVKFPPLPDLIKYGVISKQDTLKDISEWSNLYVAGRLQKPVKFRGQDPTVQYINQFNLMNALTVSLLMASKLKFSDSYLYEGVALISYLGDPRMAVGGENPNKVKNIVSKQMDNFVALYNPWVEYFIDRGYLVRKGNLLILNLTLENRQEMLMKLPLAFRNKLFYLYYKQINPVSTIELAGDQKLPKYIVQALKETVSGPAAVQAIKGLFTAGLVKSLKYMIEKRLKYTGLQG